MQGVRVRRVWVLVVQDFTVKALGLRGISGPLGSKNPEGPVPLKGNIHA